MPADRLKERPFSRRGTESDQLYSGKARQFRGNNQVLFTRSRISLWVSPVLPGEVHGVTGAHEHVLAILRPFLKDSLALADSGDERAGCVIHIPVQMPTRSGEIDLNTRSLTRCCDRDTASANAASR